MSSDAKKILAEFIDKAICEAKDSIDRYEGGVISRNEWIRESTETIAKYRKDIEDFKDRIAEEKDKLRSLNEARNILENMP